MGKILLNETGEPIVVEEMLTKKKLRTTEGKKTSFIIKE